MTSFRIIDSHLALPYLKHFKSGDTFIETGTYRGDTVYIAKEAGFAEIWTCEIYEPLFNDAVKIFADDPTIHIIKEESPDFIEMVLNHAVIDKPATFWLDAHASGPLGGGKSVGSPVLDELRRIRDNSTNREHTILIDDRRLFGNPEWGGVTEKEAMNILDQINPNYNIFYLDGVQEQDIICATVKGPFKNE